MLDEQIEDFHRRVQCARAQALREDRHRHPGLPDPGPGRVNSEQLGNVGQSPKLSFEEELAWSL